MEHPVPIHITEGQSEDKEDIVKEELDALFSFNPPVLEQNPRFSPFLSVSPVSFHDKHLDDRLILKRIRLMPSLLQSLSRTVDETFKSLNDRGIPIPATLEGFMLHENRERYLRMVEPMTDARSVAEFYKELTAKSCYPVASTLVFHPHADYWWSVFNWREERDGRPWWEEQFTTQEYALRLNATPQHDFIPLSMFSLDEATTTTLQQVAKRFPQLATWDIYALSPDVKRMLEDMESLASSGSFSSEIPLTTGYKRLPSIHEIPDATKTPWNIPLESSNEADTTNTDSNIPAQMGHIMASTDVARSSGVGEDTIPRLRRSARLEEMSIAKDPMGTTPDSKEAKVARKRGGRPAPDDRVIRPPSRAIKSTCKYDKTHFPPTEEFLQHAWAQSVRDDSSLIIFHGGNFERIGLRHRKSQTLFLSELIHVSKCQNPSYGKLHVGLYIAAIRDSIDRSAQSSEIEPIGGNPKHSDHDRLTTGDSKKRLLPDYIPVETNKRHKKDEEHKPTTVNNKEQVKMDPKQNNEVLLAAASLRNLVLIRLQYGVYNSPVPASFLRYGPSITPAIGPSPPRKAKDAYRTHEYFTLILTSHIADGATGVVHGATLKLETSDAQSLSQEVVVKLAFLHEQQERMRNEYTIYRHLAMANVTGVPTVLGLFKDLEGGSMALVMNDAGVSLLEQRADREGQVTVSTSERAGFIRILHDIHRAGVRHRDIRPENLLVNDTGEVVIIDFDKAEMGLTKGAQKREDEKLLALLDGDYTESDGQPSLPSSPESKVA